MTIHDKKLADSIAANISFDDAMRGYRRRRIAQRPSIETDIFQALTRAGNRLYGDRLNTPECARKYIYMKRHRIIWAGAADRLAKDIF